MKIKTANDYLSEAKSEIEMINATKAKEEANNILFVDVRDKHEREDNTIIEDSVLLSRGMLEFYADKNSPYFNKSLETDKKIVVFCTLGARGALAAKTLQDMGYDNVFNLENGLQDW